MVEIIRSYPKKVKGKFCHFQKDDFFRHNLGQYYWMNKDNIDLEELKGKIVPILKSDGFVFFDTIEYKAKFKFGCLVEFAVQYWHIN